LASSGGPAVGVASTGTPGAGSSTIGFFDPGFLRGFVVVVVVDDVLDVVLVSSGGVVGSVTGGSTTPSGVVAAPTGAAKANMAKSAIATKRGNVRTPPPKVRTRKSSLFVNRGLRR